MTGGGSLEDGSDRAQRAGLLKDLAQFVDGATPKTSPKHNCLHYWPIFSHVFFADRQTLRGHRRSKRRTKRRRKRMRWTTPKSSETLD